ncbi:hypothetical protein Lal_00022183 [Lupinus albus]|nr:hypothetical protein Lal_00022183 [Lupinus albus]
MNIRNKLNIHGMYADNYLDHDNGRIWIIWDNSRLDVRVINSTSQLIHCGVYNLDGSFKYWLSAIYALNNLEQRKRLWGDIERIHNSQQGPWCLIGDFNNVIKAHDRIEGKKVTEHEYIDFTTMMEKANLYEMDSSGEYYTWSNKQTEGTIYSRIDRAIGKEIPFFNCVVNMEDYTTRVKKSWNEPIKGRPMYVMWEKLKRLQGVLRNLSKPITNVKQNITKARHNLLMAQLELNNDRMNGEIIEKVKKYSEELIKLNELEENILKQKSKIEWLKLGDGNTSYFYASLKSKQKAKSLHMLYKEDGVIVDKQDEIEKIVLDFYGGLMGTKGTKSPYLGSARRK